MRLISRLRALPALLALAAAAPLLAAAVPATASAKTVWLCRPGLAHDPCTPGLSTTRFTPQGVKIGTENPATPKNPPIDCFYVYPTVSGQPTTLANFDIDPVERSIALYQAARYSQLCKVYAPIYRQVTLTALLANKTETAAQLSTGLLDVRRAFADYLAHDNHGRGFVLIGHSQGSFVLRSLIAKDVDPKPAVRKRMLSAILLGGNVLVKRGREIGGDFRHVPGCTRASQLGCIIAWSTFDTPIVAKKSLFGISPNASDQVLCTNPAALSGRPLDLIAPEQPFYSGSALAAGIALLGFTYPKASTTWLAEPGAYSASCSSANGGTVLQISPRHGAVRPKPSPDATWGLHLLDANIALGNLLSIVSAETKAYLKR